MFRKFRLAGLGGAIALIIAVGAGTLAGQYAAEKTAKKIPILIDAEAASTVPAQVSFADGFAPILKRAIPAVVNVSSSKVVRTPVDQGQSPALSDPFFRQFFGRNLPRNFQTPPSEQREHSLGSGVIVNSDGYILTNNHVIDGAKDVKVSMADKREFQARVVGTDPRTDIAVLKVDAKDLPVLTFGDSSKMLVGNFVLAIGDPFELNQTVTLGIVSATGRGGLGIEDYEDFIQTDAAINPGNSGGALINSRGDLIGINTAIVAGGSGGNQGVGFAIPVNMARNVMDQILMTGKVTRAWLGVSIQPVTQSIAKAFHLPETSGALVGGVTSDTPAAKAGIKTGDIILKVNGQTIEDSRSLQLMIGAMSPGTTIKLDVFRNGAPMEVAVKLGDMPAAGAAQNADNGQLQGTSMRGLSIGPLTGDIASELKLPSGTKGVVVMSVDSASAAADAGLAQGDVIQEVNHHPVFSVDGFNREIHNAANQPVLLLINRNGSSTFVVVQSQ